MDPSSGQQHQEMISSHSMENMLVCSKAGQERKPRPQPDQALKCPRCDSTNTKFCYYNNYSLTQPRYFCKSCRRYWTKGGTLRNVPVGGGCRKSNKRSSSSSSASSALKRAQDQPMTPLPLLGYDSNDLTLAFSRLQRQTSGQMGYDHAEYNPSSIHSSPAASSAPPPPIFLDALRSGFLDTQNANFMYYGGYGNGHMGGGGGGGEMENSASVDMVLPYEDVAVAPMKQELGNGNGNGREENENRILWGFPWQQINGSGSINMMGGGAGANGVGEFESSSAAARESWINGLGTNWHGLLNSALM